MTPLLLGLTLTVLASLALNAGYLLQHVGGAAAPTVDVRRPLASVRGLLRSRAWIGGTAVGTAGSLLHAGALSQAPISLVQAFSAAGLAILVPVAARVTRVKLRRPERLAVAVIVLALGALAVQAAGTAARAAHPPGVALTAGLVLAAVAAGWAGRRRTAALGLATGMLYGVADAATKAFTSLLGHGLPAALASPWPGVFAVSCAAAFFTFQRGLQRGPAVTVIAVMTGALNVTAVGAGLALFGETLGRSTPVACLHAAALTAVLVASWWLARAQARAADGAAAPPARTIATRGAAPLATKRHGEVAAEPLSFGDDLTALCPR